MTGKDRAFLRKNANNMDPVCIIGKDGVDNEVITSVRRAITARELIKCKVLETSPCTAREAADEISDAINCDVIQVIGGKFVLYKYNKDIARYGIR